MTEQYKNILETEFSNCGSIIDIKLTKNNYMDCLFSEGICGLVKDNVILTKNSNCIYRQYCNDEKNIFRFNLEFDKLYLTENFNKFIIFF